MTNNPLILVDGSSFLYRAYHVSRQNFTNSKGIPTGVSLIITKMMQSLLNKFAGSKFIVVFDAKGKSFRAQMYSEYKANRPPMPEDLKVQVEYVHKIVKALGFPLVQVEGVEADDVLGTYAKLASADNLKTIICTGDKDLAQLVDDNVILYDSMKETFLDKEGVAQKFGVAPEYIIDFLALKGDSSDNIPGMAGCGDKTAVGLINALGGIEDILKRKDEIATLPIRGAKTLASKYEDSIDLIRLSYQLATIKTDVALPLSLQELDFPRMDKVALTQIFTELEFKKLLQEIDKYQDPVNTQSSSDNTALQENIEAHLYRNEEVQSDLSDYQKDGSVYELVTTVEKLQELCKEISLAKTVALDTETTSLTTNDCSIVGMSLSFKEKSGYYIPLNHSYLGVPSLLTVAEIKQYLEPVLNASDIKIVGHNIKFDLEVLHYHGIEISKVYADTMVLAHLLDSSVPVNMDDLAKLELNYKTITYEEVTNHNPKLSIGEVSVEQVCIYASEDADITLRLFNKLSSKLEQSKVEKDLFYKVEMPFLDVLYKMELNGVYVDKTQLQKQDQVLKEELVEIRDQIYTACGQTFNIASPKQLAQVLFVDLKIPYPKKTKTGKYSTSQEILEEIAPNYDVANLVLRYRELAKLISTYTEKLQTLISPTTHRIYTSFNQTGTVTGRLSSSSPNLQNIPARTHEGKLIRKAFVAPSGYKLISADYSQIELRLIAHMSQDPNLIKAFLQGYDVHKATAAEVLGKPIEEVTAEERSHAKATNFGLMYGMGAFGLTKQTHMSMKEAKVYIERYFLKYPTIKNYMEQTKQFAHEHGYVLAFNGRKITIANINSSNTMLLKAAERAAINAPMQGSAADIIKKAMITIQQWIDTLPKDTIKMTVQVHDELLFEVKEDFEAEAKKFIEQAMEQAATLSIPLSVGIGVSDNWCDAH